MTAPQVLITGANTGIGLATAEALAAQGAHLILACRNAVKAEAAQRHLLAQGAPAVELVTLDLSQLSQVEQAAEEIQRRFDQLDILINNAGIYTPRLERTAEGLEAHFGVNYVGHFLLTHRLLPRLLQQTQARIIHLASIAHWVGRIQPKTFEGKSGLYLGVPHYGQSKLANLLFSHELAMRLQGSGVTSNALHPGGVASDIYRKVPTPARQLLLKTLVSPTVPAKLITEMALSPDWATRNGEYVSAHMPDWQSSTAQDPQAAHTLYEQTLALLERKGHHVTPVIADPNALKMTE